MSSEIVTSVPEGARRPSRSMLGQAKVLALQLLGPLTILGGLVWAIAQPYRLALRDPAGKGVYDFLVQGPLLVGLVGLVFAILIAPGLIEDLEAEEHASSG